jgi:hypothetical protein
VSKGKWHWQVSQIYSADGAGQYERHMKGAGVWMGLARRAGEGNGAHCRHSGWDPAHAVDASDDRHSAGNIKPSHFKDPFPFSLADFVSQSGKPA